MINHNLRIADGRWYGKSVVLRKEAARNEERARPPSTYILGDAIPIGNNDGHGSEGYNHLLAFTGQVRPNSASLRRVGKTQSIHQRLSCGTSVALKEKTTHTNRKGVYLIVIMMK